jgi:hypothetical protein
LGKKDKMVYGVIISLAALAAVWKVCNTCVEVQRIKHSVTYPMESHVEAEHMLAWSISSALAAICPSELEYLSEPLAGLVRGAQALHPRMAQGARRREANVALH